MKLIVSIVLFLITISLTSYSISTPLVDISKEHKLPPVIEKFRYWYGDIDYGYLIYLGKEDVAGFETELHLHFSKMRITSVIMILGPAGLDDNNCLKQYRTVVDILNKKYGHYTHQKTVKDPLANDLISSTICAPVRTQLYDITNYWILKSHTVISKLIGDDDGFYIEIEYRYSKGVDSSKKKLEKFL